MKKKYDSALGRSPSYNDRLARLAARFDSLEEGLSQLELDIEKRLPGLGIAVSPLGKKRKGIPALASDTTPPDKLPMAPGIQTIQAQDPSLTPVVSTAAKPIEESRQEDRTTRNRPKPR